MPAMSAGLDKARKWLTAGRLGWGALAIAVLALAAWALWPKSVGVDIATVVRGPMAVSVEEEGKTRIKDVYVVSAPQSGIVLRSPLLAGDAVTKEKTLVAVLQPAQPPFIDLRTRLELRASVKAAQAAVRLADAEVEQARADQRFADAEVARAKTLAKTQTVSEQALEKATHAASVAKAAVEKAEANGTVKRRQLESVEAKLADPQDETLGGVAEAGCCVEVRSPVTGRVLTVHQTSEQVIPAGTPLVEVGDPRMIEIVADLLSTDAVKVSEGAHVQIVGWGGGETLTGTVHRVETAGFTKVSALGIEEQRVRVVIYLDEESRARHKLGHAYRVIVRIRVWQGSDVLKVPIGALFRYRGEWAIYRIEGHRAVLTIVALGHRNESEAEVLSGLSKGNRVVLYPSDRVKNGVRVSERPPEAH
ncbi:MAG: HlyD family efflux transporter periplasmic adaptor subunit [Hyphomicrobiaceae bacterium]